MTAAGLVSSFDPDGDRPASTGAERGAFAMYWQVLCEGSTRFAHGRPIEVDEFTARRRWAALPDLQRQRWVARAVACLEAGR